MAHETHEGHQHEHHERCGHTQVRHDGHVDFVHDGHLHSEHEGHYDEHEIEVGGENPEECAPVECACGHRDDCGHELVPHGDHQDYLFEGRLHHPHGDHCDDHGPVEVVR